MSNANAPFGARPVNSRGAEIQGRPYKAKASTAIYKGDFVTADAAGTVDVSAAAEAILGVAAEYKAAADTDRTILVYDDPDFIYEIQADGDFAAADVFKNADIVAGAGSTTLLQSGHVLDSSTMDTTATLQLKILGLASVAENAVGSYARVLVKINNATLGSHTGTVGV